MEKNINKTVLLSWSGDESKEIAKCFKNMMSVVFSPVVETYMSEVDSPIGKRGVESLAKILNDCNYGVFFVNKANALAPWIHYEAGAISKESPISRLMVLLLDNNPMYISGTPLSDFTYSMFNKEGVLKIINAIIDISGYSDKKENFINRFNNEWPNFYDSCEKIKKQFNTKNQDIENEAESTPQFETIMHLLVDIQNYLKNNIGGSMNDMIIVNQTLKDMVLTISSKEITMMQVQYKNKAYEKLLTKTAHNLDETIDILDTLTLIPNEESEKSTKAIENLKNIRDEVYSLIYD